MTQPALSICMPAFNAGPFIDQAIASLREQTFDDFELLIVDDGSEDETGGIARRHAAVDSRVRVLVNDGNKGLVYTRNRLLAEAACPLVALADADDVFAATRMQQQVSFLHANSDVGVVGGNVEFRDAHGNATAEPSNLYQEDAAIRFFLMLGPCIWNTVTMYRKELLQQIGGFGQGLDRGAEDYDLWCRLSKITKFANLKSILASVHVHPGSVTANEDATKSNIYGIAQPMLSQYLGREVSLTDAKDLVLLFWNGLGTRADFANVIELAQDLKQNATTRENSETYALFAARLHESLWNLGTTNVYSNRAQSFKVMSRAMRLKPMAAFNPRAAKYFLQLLTPDWLRQAVKSPAAAS